MNLYVGNLSHQATEADVQQAFEAFGQVASATIIKDKLSGESRGFAFVEMPVEAEAAIAVWGDTQQRFSIDSRRRYMAGLSGGARVASSIALSCGDCVAGVIANAAGFPPGTAAGRCRP